MRNTITTVVIIILIEPSLYTKPAAVAKSLQSCPTLCDPRDSSPLGSPVPWILQAITLEWVAISFSSAWKWKVNVKSLSRVRLLATPWTAAYQAPPSMGFSRQEYWSGVPSPSPIHQAYKVSHLILTEIWRWVLLCSSICMLKKLKGSVKLCNLDQCYKKVRTIFWELECVPKHNCHEQSLGCSWKREAESRWWEKNLQKQLCAKLSLDSILKMLRTPLRPSTYPI